MQYLDERNVALLLCESATDARAWTKAEWDGSEGVGLVTRLVGPEPPLRSELLGFLKMVILQTDKVVVHSNLYLKHSSSKTQ